MALNDRPWDGGTPLCLVISPIEFGVDSHYLQNVTNVYRVAMPLAFFCVPVVQPIVAWIVAWTVHGIEYTG